MATVDWSPFPSIPLLNLLCPYHSTLWDFLFFMLLPCINVLQHNLWKTALEESSWAASTRNLQRGFSSHSWQIDSTHTSFESSLSPFGCCSPQAQSISKWWGQTPCWGWIVLPCRVVPVDTPSWCWFGNLASCTACLLIPPLSFL